MSREGRKKKERMPNSLSDYDIKKDDVDSKRVCFVEDTDVDNEVLEQIVTGTKQIKNLSLHHRYNIVVKTQPRDKLVIKKEDVKYQRFNDLSVEDVRFYVQFMGINDEVREVYLSPLGENENRRRA